MYREPVDDGASESSSDGLYKFPTFIEDFDVATVCGGRDDQGAVER